MTKHRSFDGHTIITSYVQGKHTQWSYNIHSIHTHYAYDDHTLRT